MFYSTFSLCLLVFLQIWIWPCAEFGHQQQSLPPVVLLWGERYACGCYLPLQHHQLWEVKQPVQLRWAYLITNKCYNTQWSLQRLFIWLPGRLSRENWHHLNFENQTATHDICAVFCVCMQACRYWCTLSKRQSVAGPVGSEQEQTSVITSRYLQGTSKKTLTVTWGRIIVQFYCNCTYRSLLQ